MLYGADSSHTRRRRIPGSPDHLPSDASRRTPSGDGEMGERGMADVGAAGGGSGGSVEGPQGEDGLEGWEKVEREWLQSTRAAGQVCVHFLSGSRRCHGGLQVGVLNT